MNAKEVLLAIAVPLAELGCAYCYGDEYYYDNHDCSYVLTVKYMGNSLFMGVVYPDKIWINYVFGYDKVDLPIDIWYNDPDSLTVFFDFVRERIKCLIPK